MSKVDLRYKVIGGRHRALARYYAILHRLNNTDRPKNKCYKDVSINISKDVFIKWFMDNDFDGCSVDRVDNKKGYSLDNIQLISTIENIRKDKVKAVGDYCKCCECGITKTLDEMCVDNRRYNGRTTLCKACDRIRGIEKYNRLYKKRGCYESSGTR